MTFIVGMGAPIRRTVVLVTLGCAALTAAPVHAEGSGDRDRYDNSDSDGYKDGGYRDRGDTDVVFEVRPTDGLTISVPSRATLSRTVPGGTAWGRLGEVEVADERSAPYAQWTAIVSLRREFTPGGHGNDAISGSRVRYASGPPIHAFNGPFFPGSPGSLDNPRVAFSHPDGSGNNFVSWNPSLAVHVPESAVADLYRGTVTYSVA
ncbi:hypothetical protein OG735_38680 [Streptomyces sp. NBC_01210]|uniref:hypothetical protein n=1 Tax=Streptomyces sp. NBC_01210 TaxID=2903774 RepID=UPI002E1688B2|nr:hypothetical protein OG735_38680 [Streptomyces sp. NBC_01210]